MRIFLFLLLASSMSAQTYPPGAGFVDVKAPPYNAKGDGVVDDTRAIQRAIADNAGIYTRGSRTLYLPAGTYLVSDTLNWLDSTGRNAAHLTFQGDGAGMTIIRLKDSAPGFSDPGTPKSVIFTRANHNPEWYKHSPQGEAMGEGHVAFHNNLFDFTVDTGKGNPGAIGVNFHSSNQGSISGVSVVSGDGSGVCAFELTRRNVGPSLVSRVRSEGFDFGLRFAGLYCVTIENAEFANPRVAAVRNSGGVVSVRKLRVTGAPTAFENATSDGLVVLLDSSLSGTGPAALSGEGKWLIRDVETPGFEKLIDSELSPEAGTISEWTNGPAVGQPPISRLPVKDPPPEPIIPVDGWASVTDFGAKAADFVDDSDAIQAALNSGKPGILFPFSAVVDSRYLVTKPLVIPPHVRRIAGAFSNIFAIEGPGFPKDKVTPVLQASGEGEHLLIDRLVVRVKKDIASQVVAIEHAGKRSLVIRHALLNGFRSTEASGELFLEDVSSHASEPQTFDFAKGTNVWARQLDTEDWTRTKIANRGANLWVLGLKTERPTTVLEQYDGTSEIYGGLFYQHHPMPPATPALLIREGKLTASFATATGGPRTYPGYQVLLQDDTRQPPVTFERGPSTLRSGDAALAIVPLLNAPLAMPEAAP